MNWKSSFLIFVLLALSCKTKKEEVKIIPNLTETSKVFYKDGPLVAVEDLIIDFNTKNYKIIDFRKKKDYEESHLPGAINIWRDDIEDQSYPYKGMMASKEIIEALFSRMGIENKDTLIIYDKHGGYDATRLWWVLQNYDFGAIKILNGGIKTWRAVGGKTTNEVTKQQPSTFKLPTEGSMKYVIDLKTLLHEMEKENPPLLLDTRTMDEFTGKHQKSGATRAGRLPHSRLIDWAEAVEYHGSGKFRSIGDLENLYGQLGISKNHPIVTYCHTGVRSAHTTFVLTQLLGYKDVKNYDGSWSEWSYHEDLLIEKDSVTLILQ